MLGLALARLSRANLSQTHAALLIGVQVTVSDLRDKALGLPGLVNDTVKLINLFKRETLCLVDHEPHKGDADEAKCAPNEKDLGLKVRTLLIDHVGCGVRDGPVKKLQMQSQYKQLIIRREKRTQLEAVVIDRHLARALSGYNSPVTTHATGPHELAKKKM
jgi:hypothetical protein